MFVINDLELLARLSKHKILSNILLRARITISCIKLNEYSIMLKKQIPVHSALCVSHSEEGFDEWVVGKRQVASLGDLSSLYLAKQNDMDMVLSDEDTHLSVMAKINRIRTMNFDEFIRRTVNDQRMIQIYQLLKAA